MATNRIHVVLNRPIYPRNVGMCARAMANMGVDDLIIVAPRADVQSDEAKQGAANAQAVLRSARVYSSLDDFYAREGEGVRIALSGRDGRLINASDFASKGSLFVTDKPLYLFFGPEDDGLANEETRLCHHVCRLPTFGPITSLNLSHAVLLTLYMVQAERQTPPESYRAPDEAAAPPPAFYPAQTIHRWLDALGFDLSSPRVSIEKTLNRILLSHNPEPEELRLLDTVLQQTVRKLTLKD